MRHKRVDELQPGDVIKGFELMLVLEILERTNSDVWFESLYLESGRTFPIWLNAVARVELL